jgi:hypothetical protein
LRRIPRPLAGGTKEEEEEEEERGRRVGFVREYRRRWNISVRFCAFESWSKETHDEEEVVDINRSVVEKKKNKIK